MAPPRQHNPSLRKKQPGRVVGVRYLVVAVWVVAALIIWISSGHLSSVEDSAVNDLLVSAEAGKLEPKIRMNQDTHRVPVDRAPTIKESIKPTATVAHAISFLSCSATLTAKYKDAMLVLRHSIHQNSIHYNHASNYSYQMYAFINDDPASHCAKYAPWMQRMGYTPVLRPNPVNVSAIDHNPKFRDHIDSTGVTGSSEMIKLYLYTLTDHPIVVHWDIDIVVLVRRPNSAPLLLAIVVSIVLLFQ